mgnify:CR=1 FL=1
MLDLSSFFDGMSKPLLRDVHARAYGKKGLLNNALIQSEVLSYFSDVNRVKALFVKMEPWQCRCLNLIYHSGSRGLSYNELRLTVPVGKNRELQSFLLNMCREFVMWRSVASDTQVYCGFKNFVGCFEIESQEQVNLGKPSLGYGNLIDWHICYVLSLARKGELHINSNGSLHRRSYQMCVSALTSASKISEKVAENEVSLIFNFLTQNVWLEQENSCLYPSEKALGFLRKNGFRLHQDLLDWWVKVRFRGDSHNCIRLLRSLEKGRDISDAAFLFWVMDPSYRILDRNKQLPWDYIPRHLRELWLLGLVDFQMANDKGVRKIEAVLLNKAGSAWLTDGVMPLPEQNVSALPNFDLVTTTGTSPQVLFMLACLAQVKNDETYLNFTFDKDTYLAGLKSGLREDEIEQFCTWIKPPENVMSVLGEWNSSFFGARVRTARLLKIDDAGILEELSKFPQFVEFTEEFIPGYGFILRPEMEKNAFEILESFGFCPFVDSSVKNREPAPTDEWRKDFAIAWSSVDKPDYELKDEVDELTIQNALNATKYGSLYQKLDTFDLVKVLRFAKTTGTLLAAQIKNPEKRAEKMREIIFYVHSLHFAKAPFNVEIQEYGSEEKYPLMLSYIQEVKTLHKKMA